MTVELHVDSGDAMRGVGAELATLLLAGDLVVLTGPLGAGKTTLAQGVGAGLKVRGPIASPTFIIARTHPSEVGGPSLVHVDAYRLASLDELDHLDLDTSLDDAITLVEWGEGKAEALSENRLHVVIDRGRGDLDLDNPERGSRTVLITGHGPRWVNADLARLGVAQ